MIFNHRIIPPNIIEKFLNTSLIKNKLIEIDYWSFVHVISGALLFLISTKFKMQPGGKFLIVFIAVVVWELIEFVDVTFFGLFFRPESLKNIIGDVIFTMTAFSIPFFANS